MALIIVGVVLVIIILWFISAQRKLVAMDRPFREENQMRQALPIK